MIRFILTAVFIVSFLIVSIPLLIAEWILGKFNMEAKNRSSLVVVNFAFRVCLFISGVRLTVLNEENVPLDTPVLYIGNHRSFFDILLTYTRVPRPTGYVAKKEMLKIPLLSHWMKNLHCLFLDRDNLKEGLKTILTGIEEIKSGISICIFPEGTRNKTPDTFLPFHDGSFKMAEKSKCPVVPICLNNASAIFEDQFPKIRKAHVVMEYGKPVYLSELTLEERRHIGAYMQERIKEMYDANKSLV